MGYTLFKVKLFARIDRQDDNMIASPSLGRVRNCGKYGQISGVREKGEK